MFLVKAMYTDRKVRKLILMTNKNKKIFYILMVLSMIAWGAAWVHTKVLSAYINEYELIILRNFFTILTILPIILYSRKQFYISKQNLLLATITSIIMILYLKFYFLGTQLGTASLGGALVTTLIPINTFIIMALFFNRKIEKKDKYALGLGAIGVLTTLNVWSLSLEEIFTLHNTYFLLASIMWPLITIISSKATKTSPLIFTFYIYVIMSILVMIFFVDIASFDYASYDSIFWINILSLAVISTTFATTIYFIGIEKLGTNEVSSFIFLVPLSAIILSIIFLKEEVHFTLFIGTFLTLIAVKILNNITIFKTKDKIKQ
jgi:drug/metabolite transporter (DMT)-like permease